MTLPRRIFRRVSRLLTGRDRGSVAIQFVLVIPLLIVIIGTLVQFTLEVNGYFTVIRAVQAAGRSAMTSLPTDQSIGQDGGPDYVVRAAEMTLESLSPRATGNPTDEALAIAQALQDSGLTLPDNYYAARFTYAQDATTVTIDPIDANGNVINYEGNAYPYATKADARVRVTVVYKFQLTVPLMNRVVGTWDTVGGVPGWYLTLSAQTDVQLSAGREAVNGG